LFVLCWEALGVPDEDEKPPSKGGKLSNFLDAFLATQLARVARELISTGPHGKPTRNGIDRRMCATVGSFVTLLIAVPGFFWASSRPVFFAFLEWIGTASISVNIAAVISGSLLAVLLALSSFIGFVASASTPDEATHWELTMRGSRYTYAWAIRLFVGLVILVTLWWVIMKIAHDGPLLWR
jgi:hypothetical protein